MSLLILQFIQVKSSQLCVPKTPKEIHISYSLAGRSVLGETVPCIYEYALGLYSRQSTVFPNRLANNILIFFLQEHKAHIVQQIHLGLRASWKNSTHCQNQSDCMIYRILPASTLRKNNIYS